MRVSLVLIVCAALAVVGCRKRKVVPPAPAETVSQPEAAAQPATPSAPSQVQPSAKPDPAADIPSLEAGVEFGDLNNIIEGFMEFHKRPPTMEELKKSYYGGTKPIPIPPGYRLVIDPKAKKAKLVR